MLSRAWTVSSGLVLEGEEGPIVGEGAHSKYARRAPPVRMQVSETLNGAAKPFFLMLRKCFCGFRTMYEVGFRFFSRGFPPRGWSVDGGRAKIFVVVHDFFVFSKRIFLFKVYF